MTDDAALPSSGPGVPAAPPSPAAPVRVVRLRELSPKTMWLTAVVIAVLTAGAVVVLWWPATAGLNGAELVTARLDALKIGLSIGVGSGGVIALYLAWRRQHSTEADLDNRERALAHQQEVAAATIAYQDQVARDTKHDAAERRLTELYLKAVEQLGSVQAAVRHGGLYALERVAQDNPSQRQTVIDVICAYLRNPYTPPGTGEPRRLGVQRPLLRSATTRRRPPPPPKAAHTSEDRLQEGEVRLTAQRVLCRHLQPGDDPEHQRQTFWPDIVLDLTGATLIDFTLVDCRVNTATFQRASFTGDASFIGARFTGGASFSGARFTGDASFSGARFASGASFDKVSFTSGASFIGARFTGDASFDGARFTGGASFGGVTFTGDASFDVVSFTGDASFIGASFTGDASFNVVSFTSGASFSGLAFTGDASFIGASFTGDALFGGVTFTGDAWFDQATFASNASFTAASFTGGARFGGASFTGVASFDRATFASRASFDKVTFIGGAWFDGATKQGLAFTPVNLETQLPDEEDADLS